MRKLKIPKPKPRGPKPKHTDIEILRAVNDAGEDLLLASGVLGLKLRSVQRALARLRKAQGDAK